MLANRRPAPGQPVAGTFAAHASTTRSALLTRIAPCAALLACSGLAHAQTGFFPLADLPGGAASSQAFGLSADGRVVVGLGSQTDGLRAVSWVDGQTALSLGNLTGGFGTVANGASADGSVIVGYGFTQFGIMGFRWSSADGIVELGDLPGGGVSSYAARVSADGRVIVGDSVGAAGQEAFRWTAEDGMVGLGDFPGGASISLALDVSADGSVVVGYGLSANGFEAFRWTEADGLVALGDLPGGGYMAQGIGVSGGGDFVVGRSLSAFGQEAFLWSADAGMTPLGDLAGGRFDSIANDVSDDGLIVVGRGSTVIGNEALIWTPSTGTMRLADYLTTERGFDLSGWRLIDATSVSADGTVVAGYGVAPSGSQQAWFARLSEPVDPCPEDAFVTLWPVDSELRSFDIASVAGVDGTVTILEITSDEPVNGLNDGYSLQDAKFAGGVAHIRAERNGMGDGRVYQIRYAVDDAECEASVFVLVPRNEGEEAIDSGQSFDATARAMAADVDGDGYVDAADLGLLLSEWRMCGLYPDRNGPDSDLDGDGRVFVRDLLTLLHSWHPRGFRMGPVRSLGHGRRR